MLTTELAMTDTRSEYITRENILKLLSDEEIARISTAETAKDLVVGAEYVDLEALDLGVRHADGTAVTMGHALPKSAVHAATWSEILKHLAPAPKP